jgi:signal transduction histidine kinase
MRSSAIRSGYLFNALIIVPHALTFPGVFAPTGLLAAGDQTTAWLYVFWHGGFPLFVIAYAAFQNQESSRNVVRTMPAAAALWSIIFVAALVASLSLLATLGMNLLPPLIRGGDFSLLVSTGVSPAIWGLGLVALFALWRCRKPTVLDVWLMVVMWAWLLDVALSAVISSSRYDLGWYVGRSYGLLAASFVLAVLLIETSGLHDRLATAKAMLADRARDLERRVNERTDALRRSNEALKLEITQRQRTEEQLRHAQKMEALGQLTGGLAHDFNNLLAVVIGNLDLLKELRTASPEEEDLVHGSLEAALSGAELTRRLLAFARRQPLQPEQIETNKLIEGISKLLDRTLGEDIEVRLDLDPAVGPIVADRVQLETAIANLANNARDAMPNGGQLMIASRMRHLDEDYAARHAEVQPGDYVVIEVSDTGYGRASPYAPRSWAVNG